MRVSRRISVDCENTNAPMSDEMTEKIIGAAIEVHRHLGPGLLERIYEEALCHEFELRSISYERQVPFPVIYKGKTIDGQRLDVVVEKQVIVELKARLQPREIVMAQVLSQLAASGYKRALIVNFSERRLIDGVQRLSL